LKEPAGAGPPLQSPVDAPFARMPFEPFGGASDGSRRSKQTYNKSFVRSSTLVKARIRRAAGPGLRMAQARRRGLRPAKEQRPGESSDETLYKY